MAKEEIKKPEVKAEGPKLSFEQLFASKKFKTRYQYDFSKIVLGDKLYTPTEAEEILNRYFNKKGEK